MRALDQVRRILADAGLQAGIVVRDLDDGGTAVLDPARQFPCASLVKVPLALATLLRVHRGELAADQVVVVEPPAARSDTGLGRFRHPVRIAVEDLLELAVTVSDNVAADALFALTPPGAVDAELRALGVRGVAVRHRLADLADTPALRVERPYGHLLASRSGTPGDGHALEQFDVGRANAGSAEGFADLLTHLWRPTAVPAAVAERVRDLLGGNVFGQRLAPDLRTDASRWSSKTGTLLTLRHEAGVLEHADGTTIAVVVLSASTVAATHQPEAEAALGRCARVLHDALLDEGFSAPGGGRPG
ncbi:serine hydrolase [Kineococcus sp. TBRC 1896]|uniref:Serine hydrolase n=1 Tax=Kineococcus mangrovi TaxID=1660183 RepID=A0ABV4I8I1_9ACTN